MTPSQAIAALDRQLAKHGQTVTFYRYAGTPRVKVDEVTVRAFVRPVDSEDLIGDIKQDASKVAASPTGLAGFLPFKKGDKAFIGGKERNVDIPKPIEMLDVVVRINLVVQG